MDMYLNHASFSSSISSNHCRIQDQILQVTVVSGTRLKNTEWLTTQDPYVVVQYSGTKFRTRTCKGGGTNPVFRHEKFEFELIEGLREITVVVQNSNALAAHDLIGYGKVDLQNVLSHGFQEVDCLLTNDTRFAGEIKLILHYPNAQIPEMTYVSRQPTQAPFQPPPTPPVYHHQTQAPYPPHPQPPPTSYHHQHQTTYYPTVYSNSNVYPPPPSPATYQPSAYSTYPPPGPSNVYPPPTSPGHWTSSYHSTPPSPYHGIYPPPAPPY